MAEFVVGQRWVADGEPELGLGQVSEVEARSVALIFPQAEAERRYARREAPLTRIRFEVGETIHLAAGGSRVVTAVHEHKGVLIYDTEEGELVPELSLASTISLNQPYLRLLTGQLDAPRWFAFRRHLAAGMTKLWRSRLAGLVGARANLVDHQLFVARRATAAARVRVLLADEVGLGKTLEAGMIIARLLATERASRVLIAVPGSLQIQWLVELIRRFAIRPDIYAGAEHDFSTGQVHLVPHAILGRDSALAQADFDLIVVDEAHHLDEHSPAFAALEQLSERAPHLVLLSATPEQLGREHHFARLKLLEPAKFGTYEQFLAEEKTYAALNSKLQALPASRPELIELVGGTEQMSDAELIDRLLDRHGLGRNMYRNTRAAVAGFPERRLQAPQLSDDELASKCDWLAEFARANPDHKLLVIGHTQDAARACEDQLWRKYGIDVAVFHEDMTLLERDRAAAYFADPDGVQLLVCSEIGSEGRNFQFAHHLVCLDLPDHPDLLEQRIGRLDRIGQRHPVTIHVPAGPEGDTRLKLDWYHGVLGCIEQFNPAAGATHEALWTEYLNAPDRAAVAEAARIKAAALASALREGRDALLELGSCRQPEAAQLREAVAAFEADTPLALVEEAAEVLNFHFEEARAGGWSLIPADNMMIGALPGIPAEGVEVTFDRATANGREDLMFLTWDSPFIRGLYEVISSSELGSASVALLPSRQLPVGQCLLEANFDLVVQAAVASNCRPFLQSLALRILLLGGSDKNLAAVLPEDKLNASLRGVDRKLAKRLIQAQKDAIPAWYNRAEQLAEAAQAEEVAAARAAAADHYAAELGRLRQLIAANPHVDATDLAALESEAAAVDAALAEHTRLRLSALRLIITTEP